MLQAVSCASSRFEYPGPPCELRTASRSPGCFACPRPSPRQKSRSRLARNALNVRRTCRGQEICPYLARYSPNVRCLAPKVARKRVHVRFMARSSSNVRGEVYIWRISRQIGPVFLFWLRKSRMELKSCQAEPHVQRESCRGWRSADGIDASAAD